MIPVIANTPTLVEEGYASRYGFKSLKNAGATRSDLNRSLDILGNNYMTYVVPTGLEVAEGLAGRAVGKLAGKSYYKVKDKISKKKDKESEDSDN